MCDNSMDFVAFTYCILVFRSKIMPLFHIMILDCTTLLFWLLLWYTNKSC